MILSYHSCFYLSLSEIKNIKKKKRNQGETKSDELLLEGKSTAGHRGKTSL